MSDIGNYSRLYICFVFSRSSGFCFLQLIIPSTAVVITSWVSSWMESETEFQDMISIILAITFLIFSYNEMMPRVTYSCSIRYEYGNTVIDKDLLCILGVCFMIVFLSLIKLAFVKYMRQRIKIDSENFHAIHQEIASFRTMNGTSCKRKTNLVNRNENSFRNDYIRVSTTEDLRNIEDEKISSRILKHCHTSSSSVSKYFDKHKMFKKYYSHL
ncbi:hypothetical protein DICVIV_05858 [Dictyocaulus viviparus]|uniref:Neurotransmitter-gated ion-channel transmembrane domain-containing protein n=1 Tax=Dictyocaulus viviparus TaxID=29172 RepID=A0A0D8XTV4_DICVI|nr:hypothetical protein DICVIV_05858 [Dictyocaulus viviparus]